MTAVTRADIFIKKCKNSWGWVLQLLVGILLMEKKLVEMNEEFEHLRFTDCLVTIDQLVKKYSKPDKKNKCLSEVEQKVVKCFKAGCLASLGRYHEAHSILQEISDPKVLPLVGEDYTYLLTSISELFGDGREKNMIELLEKYVPNHKKQSLYRFQLTTRNFGALSKLFLKEYMGSKIVIWQFGQVYLQYLQNLEKVGLIEFKRDGWFKYNQKLKMGLKMVNLFLDKAVKSVEESLVKYEKDLKEVKEVNQKEKNILLKNVNQCKKMIDNSKELRLRIFINEGKVPQSIKYFRQIRSQLKFPFGFMRSIVKLQEIADKPEDIDWFYIEQMENVFRTNLDFSHYTPWYDYYNQFLENMIAKAEKDNKQYKNIIDLKEQVLKLDELYKFTTIDATKVIQIYYKSLYSQYSILTDKDSQNYEKNKKSDYYRISIKGLLMQLIKIGHIFGKEQKKIQFLKDFKMNFANTLTYAHEMKSYWSTLIEHNIIGEQVKVENDNELIEEINYQKIKIAVETKIPTLQGFKAVFSKLSALYKVRVKQIEKNRKLEKGERYISDQFYTLICDYARAYIQTQTSSQQAQKIISLLIPDLEHIIEASPYNADTKLRLIQFCMLMNHGEKLVDIYFTNDIKSVQWQSLGYWFLRVMMELGVGESHDPQLDKFVKSYQENQRQTSQYGLKALKSGEINRVDEYICYRTCMQNSYNSIVLLYTLFHRYRFQEHSQYYLLQINDRINKFLSGEHQLYFNADFKVMKNQIFGQFCFADIYGIFNNYEVLHQQIGVYLHQHVIVQRILGKECQQISKNLIELPKLEEKISSLEINKVFDFKRYTFQQNQPEFNCEESKYTVKRNSTFLNLFKIVNQTRISVVILVGELTSFIKGNQVNKQLLEQLEAKILKNVKELMGTFEKTQYRSQLHSVTMIRRGLFESYNILQFIRQFVQKNKKLKFAKETVNSIAEPALEYLLEVIVGLKWSKNPSSQQSSLQKSDQLLERQLSMDLNQAKRLISKYQSMNKN